MESLNSFRISSGLNTHSIEKPLSKLINSSNGQLDVQAAITNVINEKKLRRNTVRPLPRSVNVDQPKNEFVSSNVKLVKVHSHHVAHASQETKLQGAEKIKLSGKANLSIFHNITGDASHVELRAAAKMGFASQANLYLTSDHHPGIEENVTDSSPSLKNEATKNSSEDDIFADLDKDEDEEQELSLQEQFPAFFKGIPENQNSPKDDRFELKITSEHLEGIKSHFNSIKEDLKQVEEPTIYRHSETNLPYSVLYMPKGPEKGLYILLKNKEGHREIGKGGVCRVTHALHFDMDHPEKGETRKGLRSAAKEEMTDNEVEINRIISASDAKFLAAGTPFGYQGNWSSRGEKSRKMENVEKIGFIIDIIKGTNFQEAMTLNGMPEAEMANQWALQAASALAELHQLGIVHGDIKPENYLVSEEGNVKLCDFGASSKIGDPPIYNGSQIYMAPGRMSRGAIVTTSKEGETVASGVKTIPADDIWSFGIMLSELYHGSFFLDEYSQDTFQLSSDQSSLNFTKSMVFPHLDDEGHVDHLISRCLNLNPEDRPTAAELVSLFKNL